jgi:hypothetical protein
MNRLRRGLIISGLFIILVMFLFPPFHVIYSPGIEIEKGYAFILNPPTFWGNVGSTVDINLLLFQVGMTIALMAAFHLFLKMYKK